jgi:hypothetical protein
MRILLALFIFISAVAAESYKVETIEFPPFVAPEVGGLGFTPEGELVVAFRRSGVVMAIPNQDPKKFPWRVFAEDSLHNSCGIHVVSKDEVIISQMAELTRVKDTDGDGIADLYQTISDKWGISGNYHETNTIIPDGKGGWYIALGTASHNGPNFYNTKGTFSPAGREGRNFAAVDWKGWVMHIDKDGKTTPFASGFRANNGISMSPDGKIFVTDNEGDWRGASPLYHVQKGKFYGHPSSLVWDKEFVKNVSDNPLRYYIKNLDKYEKHRTHAAIEFPKGMMCNSPSEPIFDTKGNFGPFKGQCFVGDIAGGRIIRCILEEVDGVMQGACVKFVSLRGGNNRLVFSPDGKTLYSGQTYRGWGRPSEGLQRISFTGETPFEVQKMSITKDGFKLTFTTPVDKSTVEKGLKFKEYHFVSKYSYGSKAHDMKELKVQGTEISSDGKTVTVKLGKLTAKKIVQMDVTVKAADGKNVSGKTFCYKINNLRK